MNSHYYNRDAGAAVKRPNQNPFIEAGRDAGRKRRKKDQKDETYPREGLPISREGRDPDWIEGYRRGYYQDRKKTDSRRVQTSVTVDRRLLEMGCDQNLNVSQCCDIGLSIMIFGIDSVEVKDLLTQRLIIE